MVRVWEELFFEARYTAAACGDKNPQYHKLAGSYGIENLHCDNIIDFTK